MFQANSFVFQGVLSAIDAAALTDTDALWQTTKSTSVVNRHSSTASGAVSVPLEKEISNAISPIYTICVTLNDILSRIRNDLKNKLLGKSY